MSKIITVDKDLSLNKSLKDILKKIIGKSLTPYNIDKVRYEALEFVVGEKVKYGISSNRPLYDVTIGKYLGGEVIFDIDMIFGNTSINYIEFHLDDEQRLNAVFQDEDDKIKCVYMNLNEYEGKNSGPYWFIWAYNKFILNDNSMPFYRIIDAF